MRWTLIYEVNEMKATKQILNIPLLNNSNKLKKYTKKK